MRKEIYLPLVLAVVLLAIAPALSMPVFYESATISGEKLVLQDDTFLLGDGRFEIRGRRPTGLTEFRYLYLEGAVLKASAGRRLLPQPPGRVRGELQARQKFKLRNSRFEGEHLTVETVAVRGVSYKFEGKVSNYSSDDSGVIQPQFKGTLTKLLNGKKTAEAQVTFVWIEPEF
jgi:hypothetical protein